MKCPVRVAAHHSPTSWPATTRNKTVGVRRGERKHQRKGTNKGTKERPGPYSHGERRKKKGNPRKIEGIIIPFISLFIPVARFTKVGELGNVNYISSHLVSLVEASRTRRLNPSASQTGYEDCVRTTNCDLQEGGGGEPRRQIQFVWLTNHVKTPLATPSHFPERNKPNQTKTTNPFSSIAKQVISQQTNNR